MTRDIQPGRTGQARRYQSRLPRAPRNSTPRPNADHAREIGEGAGCEGNEAVGVRDGSPNGSPFARCCPRGLYPRARILRRAGQRARERSRLDDMQLRGEDGPDAGTDSSTRHSPAAFFKPALREQIKTPTLVGVAMSGMHRQSYDLQLIQYDDRGWRATFYTTRMEHSPTSATGSAWERTPCQGAARDALSRADA